jgi:hypothetical protein
MNQERRGSGPCLPVDVHHGPFGQDARRTRRLHAFEVDAEHVLARAIGTSLEGLALDGLIEGGSYYFRIHRAVHIRHFLGTFADQRND